MKYVERVEKLEKHIADHPKDYQAVIAHLKAKSDLIEHGQHIKRIARQKRIAEVRRQRKEIHDAKQRTQ